MALGARELILIIRAQNQASGALRRVAGDLRGLGRLRSLQLRQNQLAINQARLLAQRQRELRNIESLTTGRRFLAGQRARDKTLKHLQRSQLRYNAAVARGTKDMAPHVARLRDANQAHNISKARLVENAALTNEYRSRMVTTGHAIGQNVAQQKELAKAIRQVRWDKASIVARTFGHTARLVQLAGAGVAVGVGLAANAAAKFETQVRLVATQTGKAGSGIQTLMRNSQQLGPMMLKVMGDSQASTEQLTNSTYNLFSSVDSLNKSYLTLKDGQKLLQLANKAAIAGQTDLDVSTQGIVRTMNTFGLGVNKIRKALDRAFAAVRFGEFTFAEYNEALKTTAPAARQFTQSHSQMSGALAFLSRRLGVRRAAIGYARALEILGDSKFGEEMKKQGVAIRDTQNQMLPLPKVIENITKKFPKLRKGTRDIEEFFKTFAGRRGFIQARRALVFLFQQQQQFSEMVRRVSKDNVEFSRSIKAMEATAGVRWAKFINKMRVLFLELGAAAIPTVLEIIKPIERLVKWFQNLNKETKQQIGRWLAWGGAIALVGGTVLAVVGGLLSLLATLGRLGILFRSITGVAILLVAAIKLITGEFDAAGSAARMAADLAIGSWEAFLITAALVVSATLKIRRAMLGLAGTMAIAGVAGRGGAGLMGLFGMAGAGAAGGAVAPRLARMLGKIPGPAKSAGIALTLLGGAAITYQRYAEAAAAKSDELSRAADTLARALRRPAEAAASFGRVLTDIVDFRRAKLDLADINDRLKDLRKTLKEAAPGERRGIRREIQRLLLDRIELIQAMGDISVAAQKKLAGFNRFMSAQEVILSKIQRKRGALQELQRFVATPAKGFSTDAWRAVTQDAQGQIVRLTNEIQRLKTRSQEATGAMLRQFTGVVRGLQKMQLLPKKISREAIGDALQAMVRGRKLMTLPQMRLFFKAYLDPKSLAKLPKDLQAFIKRQKADRVEVKAKITQARAGFTRAERFLQRGAGAEVKAKITLDTKRAKKEANIFEQFLKANSKMPPFQISTVPTGGELGQRIKAGIVAGTASLSAALSASLIGQINTAIAAARGAKGIDSKSPSRVTANLLGKPLTQGIIMGMLKEADNFKAGTEYLASKMVNALKKSFKGKKWLVNMLVEMGGIDLGAKMTAKEFAEQFAQAWKDAKRTAIERLRDMFEDIRSSMQDAFDGFGELIRSRREDVATNFVDFFEFINDAMQQKLDWGATLNMEDLLTSIREQVAAFTTWQSDLAALAARGVPETLLAQLRELGVEGIAIVRALVGASASELNEYIALWNSVHQAISPETILADLRAQVVAFQAWRDNIQALRDMGLPAALIAQLAALGPEGASMIQQLLTMTGPQITEYVSTWKEGQKAITEATKEEMKAQIAEWRKHGREIAVGILLGLRDERQGLLRFFKNLFKELLREARNETGSNSPSKVYYEHGRSIIQGLRAGLATGDDLAIPTPAGMRPRFAYGMNSGPTNITMHVQAGRDESLMTTLERARFRWENRR